MRAARAARADQLRRRRHVHAAELLAALRQREGGLDGRRHPTAGVEKMELSAGGGGEDLGVRAGAKVPLDALRTLRTVDAARRRPHLTDVERLQVAVEDEILVAERAEL